MENANNKPKLYARLRVKTGTYEKDGVVKNSYAEIGRLMASPHFSNMYMQLDSLPINKDWDGRVYVNPIDKVDEEDEEDVVVGQNDKAPF